MASIGAENFMLLLFLQKNKIYVEFHVGCDRRAPGESGGRLPLWHLAALPTAEMLHPVLIKV